jgi:alpha-tubulin suppressor-like RCC1 family protein
LVEKIMPFIISGTTNLEDLLVSRSIFSTGGLWGCGYNGYGSLGDNTSTSRSSPVQTVAGGTNWKQVASGCFHVSAIKQDGTLWLWGYNGYGQLGDNTSVNASSPIQTIAGGTNWKQTAGGYYSTAAIKTDGTLWLWGYNNYGTLGTNNTTWRSSPVQTIAGGATWKQVACGSYHTAAVKTDGSLWTWGYNATGGLGDNTTAHKSSPVQTVAGGTNWKQVSVGSNHCFGVKTDGTLWGWGNDSYSKLGDAGSTKRSSPIQTVAGGTTWLQAACGDQHSAAVKTDGTLWTWGDNYYGTLGDNTRTTRNSPIQTISGGTNWKSVSGNYYTIGAIKTDGTLWLWGHNAYGQLGDNTIANKSSPVQTIAGGTTWSQVSCGSGHTVALKTDGTLWTWGQNTYGQLGDTTTANRSSPVQTIAGGTTWKQVVAGFSHTAAIKTDGTLW